MSADTQALISEERTLWFYNKSRRPGRVRCRSFWAVVMPWIVAFTSMGTAAYLYRQLQTQHSRDSVELPYNPAMHLVRYENREFTLGLGDNLTKYEAEPSPSLDADWNDLFSMGIVAISREEASQLHEKTQPLPHDPRNRYVVSFSVFHDLHCLNGLRKRLFPEYYTQFALENRTKNDVKHIMHCIDALRQSTLCHSDLSIIPFQETNRAYEPKIVGAHVCRNFEVIQDWARDNAVWDAWDLTYRPVNDPLDMDTWTPGWHP
ncbi:hypothetical protein PG989_010818 [Apiospora arundinis]